MSRCNKVSLGRVNMVIRICIMNSRYLRYIFLILSLWAAASAVAFSPDIYTGHSVLSRGRWVKLSVEQTGMHLIPIADIRAWGFDNPGNVRVYGYGGRRIPDRLSLENYIDDLPMVQSEMTPRGIVFYAEGPLSRHDNSDDTHYHTANPYSTHGYYFISDRNAEQRSIPTEGGTPSGEGVTTFVESVRHELEAVSPAHTGHLIVGEDFKFTPTRRFTFNMPGRCADSNAYMRCEFFAKSSGGVQLTFADNGNTLPPLTSDRVAGTTDYGEILVTQRALDTQGEKLNLTITASPIGSVSLAHLDNITICYLRELAMPESRHLDFTVKNSTVTLSGVSESTRVWDVTNPLKVVRMKPVISQGNATWTNEYYGKRRYAAWDDNAALPVPKVAEVVRNQNIHAEPTPDMVIFTHPSLREQAERVARLHMEEPDSLRVLVVSTDAVANEFGSGCADINAMRRMLKMFYDRGSDTHRHRLQYALIMGSVNYDHRKITPVWRNNMETTVPVWQTDNGHTEQESYSTDDALAVLGDNTGLNFSSATINIAVGRIPAHNPEEAKVYVDRLTAYTKAPKSGRWRNRIVLAADNGNDNIHMTQTEDIEKNFRSFAKGRDMTYHKVYVDEFELIGGVAKRAREKLHNLLNEGVVWWNYVGHSSHNSIGREGLLNFSDLQKLYLRRAPFFYGATCTFAQWDDDEHCGMEYLTLSDAGGLIGGISATRTVYISRNGILTSALGKELFDTDSDGRMRPIGEILRRSKNRIGADSNKLRYVLLGDPAMRLAFPENTATLDSINDKAVTADNGDSEPPVITALGNTKLSGSVCSHDGNVIESFNGFIELTLYDAESSHTTHGRENSSGTGGIVFDEQGEQLYTGRAKVVNGKWECTIILPPEISDNFRNATLSMYAQSDDDILLSAVGANRDFYVYGYDENAIVDDNAPVIESMYLNHDTFRNGDAVNPTPMLLARVSDDMGINMSLAGVGHQMSLRIDETKNLSDLSSSFIPDIDGSPAGNIAYQLPELTPGHHTASLKVWDIGGNSTTASIDFYVDPTLAPKIFDVYTDANPASTEANFYIAHNRPDAMLSVRIDVYDMSGRFVWSDTTRGRADMYLTTPVKWDLNNMSGNRVGRGIYVYRATVISEGSDTTPSTSSSAAKRIAVM